MPTPNGSKQRPWLKDPDDILDFDALWATWLNGDTLATASWSIVTAATTPALVIDDSENTTSIAKVWVSGGKTGTKYQLRNRITTTGQRTKDRTFYLLVKTQ
jgi:hypothetical protein